jgi:hypothetical protein
MQTRIAEAGLQLAPEQPSQARYFQSKAIAGALYIIMNA